MKKDSWRPSSPPETAMRRAAMLGAARRYFADRKVLEVDTPLLARTTVSDPQIESLEVLLAGTSCFLQTSPEYFMKRLLAAGYPDIYQVCRAFRAGEAGRRHQPEFTLIEWSRRDFSLQEIMQDAAGLIGALVEPQRLTSPPVFLEYRDAFSRFAGVDPLLAPADELARAAGADERLMESLGRDRDAWLDLVLSLKVIPGFGAQRLTVLCHYPASQAALARTCPAEPAVADRFEIFYGDLELANGFVELKDPGEQERRFAADQARRRERGLELRPLDRKLLAALAHGLPDCAGVAVGLDRLLMINEMADDIRRVQTFAFDEGR